MENRTYKVYAVDFDGTIVKNKWPGIGAPIPEVVNFILDLTNRGDKWILYTMREGDLLQAAVNECKRLGLIPDAINDNLPSLKYVFNNNPRKIYADVYIDDHNDGGLRIGGRKIA